MLRALFFFAVGLCVMSFWQTASAQDGAFDSSFGFLGRETFPFPNPGAASIVSAAGELPDGRLVIAGACGDTTCIARLRPDGSFDPTFGPSGLGYVRFDQITGAPSGNAYGGDMAVLPDGRMVIVAARNTTQPVDVLVYVVSANGTSLDTQSGGGSGFLGLPFGSQTVSSAFCRIVAQSDGKLVLVGTLYDVTLAGTVVGVSRIRADVNGVDSQFGTGGVQTIAFGVQGPGGANQDYAKAVAVEADGHILVGGLGILSNAAAAMEVARLLPNGQRDTTFGPNRDGRFVLSDSSRARTLVAIAADYGHRVVFGGGVQNGSDYAITIGRLTATGVLDTTFSGTGLFESQPIGTMGVQSVQAIAMTSDSILAASSVPRASNLPNTYFAITRLSMSGTPSPAFGGNGTVYNSFATNSLIDYSDTVMMTSKGIVLAGESILPGAEGEVGVTRLRYDHIFANTFE